MPVGIDEADRPAAATGFDLDQAWDLSEQVSLRPESFGAMAYHFGNRRLTFLKSRTLLAVVQSLAEHGSGRAACLASGVSEGELPVYRRALASLAESGMIRARTVA
jgi:putative mycofactocin binding protein MftB